jgi:GNAT superfamily N-acetyltransferase
MTVEASAATKVERASRKDLPELRDALARAFHDDPVLGWLMPDEGRRPRRLRKFFELELRHMGFARGTVWTTADRTGACVVMPPGAWQLPPLVTLAQGPGYMRAFGRRLPRATVLQALMELRHPRTPHHYVLIVGVEPELHGRGIGSGLMAPTLTHCDEVGLPAYLEASSERSAALYERLGFRCERELRLGSSPPLRLMTRPPQV